MEMGTGNKKNTGLNRWWKKKTGPQWKRRQTKAQLTEQQLCRRIHAFLHLDTCPRIFYSRTKTRRLSELKRENQNKQSYFLPPDACQSNASNSYSVTPNWQRHGTKSQILKWLHTWKHSDKISPPYDVRAPCGKGAKKIAHKWGGGGLP